LRHPGAADDGPGAVFHGPRCAIRAGRMTGRAAGSGPGVPRAALSGAPWAIEANDAQAVDIAAEIAMRARWSGRRAQGACFSLTMIRKKGTGFLGSK